MIEIITHIFLFWVFLPVYLLPFIMAADIILWFYKLSKRKRHEPEFTAICFLLIFVHVPTAGIITIGMLLHNKLDLWYNNELNNRNTASQKARNRKQQIRTG